jgi:hypothetical protein
VTSSRPRIEKEQEPVIDWIQPKDGSTITLRRSPCDRVSIGRIVVAGPRQRNHPDFPLRGFVRCEICGRPLTGSWSKGRNGPYAFYHCQRQCRAVNVGKAALEGAFVDELALLQPTAGYTRLVKDRILHVRHRRSFASALRCSHTATAGQCNPAKDGQAG